MCGWDLFVQKPILLIQSERLIYIGLRWLFMIHTQVLKLCQMKKILYKDRLMDVSDNTILEFLKSQPGMHVKSGVLTSRLQDSENKLTHFFTGDRFKVEFSPALQSSAIVEFNRCRVWHKAQENSCGRCIKLTTEHPTQMHVMLTQKIQIPSSYDLFPCDE